MINKKICIVYSHHKLGDLIWQLPYIKSISDYHSCKITLVTRPKTQAKDILKDEVYIEKIHYNLFRKKICFILDLVSLLFFFKKENFTHIYLLDKISRPAIAARLVGVKNIIGVGIGNQSKWITNKKYLSNEDFRFNFSQQTQKFLEMQGIETKIKTPKINFSKESLKSVKIEANLKSRIFSFGVDAFDPWKIWHEEYFAKLSDKLFSNNLVDQIFLICSNSNSSYAEKIIKLSSNNNFVNCSRMNLVQIIKCLKHSICFLGNDSGPLNLSAALGIKSFGLVSNTSSKQLEFSNVVIIKPKNYNYEIDVGNQKIGDNFIKDRELMRDISVDQVFNVMKEKQDWKI